VVGWRVATTACGVRGMKAGSDATADARVAKLRTKVKQDLAENTFTVFEAYLRDRKLAEDTSDFVPAARSGFLLAAHHWGLLYLQAHDAVEQLTLYQKSGLTTTLPRPPLSTDTEKRLAYMRGYELWYICGLPETEEFARPTCEHPELHQYTVTAQNLEGSRNARYLARPLSRSDMTFWSRGAFEEYLKARADSNKRFSERPTEQPAEQPADQPADGKKRFVPPDTEQEKSRVVAPKAATSLPDQEPVVMHATMLVAMAAFKMDFTKHHAFPPSPIDRLRARIHYTQRTNDVVGWVVTDKSRTIGAIDTQMAGKDKPQNGNDLYTSMRTRHKIDELFDRRGVKSNVDIRVPDTWPIEFAALNLKLVDAGSYNSVWRFRPTNPTESPPSELALRSVLPPLIADAIINGKHVLRIPKPDSWRTADDVASEMVNVFEAASGGYGPKVVAMWCGHRLQPDVPADGKAEATFKLFMVLARGTMSVHQRLHNLRRDKATTHKMWVNYLYKLRMCVWCVSANRCVHLDSKPANFVDNFGHDVCASGNVHVIDLDSSYYGRIGRLLEEEVDEASGVTVKTAMGWKPCWLYNILVMSCNLRVVLDEHIYKDLWLRPIQKMVDHTMHQVVSHTAYKTDAEYQRAREFLMGQEARWASPFYMSVHMPEPLPGAKTALQLATISVHMAKYYFHDWWWKEANIRLVPAAKKMVHAQAAHSRAMQANETREGSVTQPALLDLENARNASIVECKTVWEWFDTDFRPKGLPMIRFFEDEMRHEFHASEFGANPSTTPLVEVMRKFVTRTTRDLFFYTTIGTPPEAVTYDFMKDADETRIAKRWPYKVPLRYDRDWVSALDWGSSQQAKTALGFGEIASVS